MPPELARKVIAQLQDCDLCPPETAQLARSFPDDPAVIASLLLRAVRLAPGESVYVPPGQLHCYLSGLAVEVQVNSDNVLRAGLTSKHVDLDCVLELVDVAPGMSASVSAEWVGAEQVLHVGIEQFALAVIADVPTVTLLAQVPGPALLLCLRGDYVLDDGGPCRLGQGESAYVSASTGPVFVRGNGLLLRVTTARAGWDSQPVRGEAQQ